MIPNVAAVDQSFAQTVAQGNRLGATMLSLARTLVSNKKALAGIIILLVFVICAIVPGLIAPYSDSATFAVVGPDSSHLLGTTSFGNDVFSQLIWGTRETLIVGGLAGLFATLLSVAIGIAGPYIGGLTDNVLSTITDIFLVLPALPLMIIIASYQPNGGVWILITVISITGWSYGARQIRPQVLSFRNRDFLESARIRGERTARIIALEVLPNMISLIVAIFLGAALYAIIAAAGLQFIGLAATGESWGEMLYLANNNEALQSGAPWWIISPGICICLLGAGVALINYAVDEIANPALRTGRRRRKKNAAAA